MHAPKLALVNRANQEIFSNKLVRMPVCTKLFKAALDIFVPGLSNVLYFKNLRKLMRLDPERKTLSCLKRIMSGSSQAFETYASRNQTLEIFCEFVEYSKKNVEWLSAVLQEIEKLRTKEVWKENTDIIGSLIVGYLHLGQQEKVETITALIKSDFADSRLPNFLSVEVFFQSLINNPDKAAELIDRQSITTENFWSKYLFYESIQRLVSFLPSEKI